MNTEKQMTNEKQMRNDELNYFFGFSRGSYGEVLGDLSRTCVNSCLTSSIPLAEFWQPANLEAIRKLFAPILPDFTPETALKFFEFPTEALFDGERVGRPSMTDIMIRSARPPRSCSRFAFTRANTPCPRMESCIFSGPSTET